MEIKINNRMYDIRFQYSTEPHSDLGEERRKTLCELAVKNTSKELSDTFQASTYCHPNDNFCKETGRKISLTRALSKTNLTKSDREKIWMGYFNR